MRNIMKSLVALVSVVGFAVPAFAADMTLPNANSNTEYVVPESSPFEGAFLGVYGGWADVEFGNGLSFSEDSIDGETPFSIPTRSADGFIMGGFMGFNRQFGKIILGVEADAAWVDASAVSDVDFSKDFTGHPDVAQVETSLDWLATLRARAGYPVGRFMPYVTGGVAFAGVSETLRTGDYLPEDKSVFVLDDVVSIPDEVRMGWVIGAGVEADLGNGWVAGAEYLYVDLNDVDVNIDGNTITSKGEFDVIKARLSRRF